LKATDEGRYPSVVTLNEWSANKKLAIFEKLSAGLEPEEGQFDSALLRSAAARGAPQVGATKYEPNAVRFEFIFNEPGDSSVVFTVTLEPPERIVFLPVPKWVVEEIWQGQVDGSYHFESHTSKLLEEFLTELAPETNKKWFQPRKATHRD
jgi:hypothetical protein